MDTATFASHCAIQLQKEIFSFILNAVNQKIMPPASSTVRHLKGISSEPLFDQTSIIVLVYPVEDILGSLLSQVCWLCCLKSQNIIDCLNNPCHFLLVNNSIAVHVIQSESPFQLLFLRPYQVDNMTSRNTSNSMNPFLLMSKLRKTLSQNCSELPLGRTFCTLR